MNPNLTTPDGKPVYGFRFNGWTNQWGNKEESAVSQFTSTTLYFIDAFDRGPEAEPPPVEEDINTAHHRHVHNLILSTFNDQFTKCRVISVRMKRGQNEKHFMRHFENELRQYSSNDLVIFYFHGKAGGQGKEYTWHLRGPGPNSINAYDFITQVNKSQADCLFLLDCFIPTNFKDVWERKDHMTEIIAAGAEMRDVDGRLLRGEQSFTVNVCRVLRRMVDKPFGPERSSIAHLLGADRKLGSKCVRIWLNLPVRKPHKGWDDKIWRICFLRDAVLSDCGLQFYKCEIQGPDQPDTSFGLPADGGARDRGNDGGNDGDNDGGSSGAKDGGNDDGTDSGIEDDDDNDKNGGDNNNDGENDDGNNGDDEDDDDDTYGGGRPARIARPDDNGFGHDSQDVHDMDQVTNPHSKKRTLSDSFKSAKRSKQVHYPSPQSNPIKEEDRDDVSIKPEEQDHEPQLERSRSRSHSTSPEVEYLGYKRRFKAGYSADNAIDLTDGFVDLTADDGPAAVGYDFPIDPALLEESLFMPQD